MEGPDEGWSHLPPLRERDSKGSAESFAIDKPPVDPRLRGPSMWSIWRCGEAVELSEDRLTAVYAHKSSKIGTVQSDLPFSPVQNICYFEVKIIDLGKKGYISIGLADAKYSLAAKPGWLPVSYGFHGDTGDKYKCTKPAAKGMLSAPPSPHPAPLSTIASNNNSTTTGSATGTATATPTTSASGTTSPINSPRNSNDTTQDLEDFIYPEQRRYSTPWRTGDVIGCGLNNTTHDLFFTRNGKSLGPAFERVLGVFYPTISLHSAGEAVSVRFRPPFMYPLYLNSAPPELIDYLPRGIDLVHGSSLTVYQDNIVEYTSEYENGEGVAQSDQPFNPAKDVGYFEVTILERGSKGWFAIGLSVANHDYKQHPGWVRGSWGYHGDDGKKFAENGRGEDFGPTYSKNDVIGCGYSYRNKKIFFTKNGQFLGVAFANIPEGLILYPTIGMQSTGEKVRVNFSPPFHYETSDITKTFNPASPAISSHAAAHRRVSCELTDYMQWTAQDVGDWVGTVLGLHQYREAFIRNDIYGEILPTLTAEILKTELGVTSYGARTKIVREIAKVCSNTSNNSNSSNSGDLLNSPRVDKEKEKEKEREDRDKDRSRGDRRVADSPLGDRSLHIRQDELVMGELLGKGFFGEVRKAHWRGTDVAVKVIYRKQFRTSDEVALFDKEIQILSILRHPCIVQFLGICIDNCNCIVTEYMAGGNLEMLVRDKFQVLNAKPNIRIKILTNIAKGCCYLHERSPPILHRDLTPRNILLDKNFNAKVADFGLSRPRGDDKMTVAVGYLPYQAPEVFKGEEYSEKADVYSFGMLVWYLFSGQSPDAVISPLKLANMVAHQNYRPSLPNNPSMDEFWRDLVTSCWTEAADSRPAFTQIIRAINRRKELSGGAEDEDYLWEVVTRGAANAALTPTNEFVNSSPRGSNSLSNTEVARLEQAYEMAFGASNDMGTGEGYQQSKGKELEKERERPRSTDRMPITRGASLYDHFEEEEHERGRESGEFDFAVDDGNRHERKFHTRKRAGSGSAIDAILGNDHGTGKSATADEDFIIASQSGLDWNLISQYASKRAGRERRRRWRGDNIDDLTNDDKTDSEERASFSDTSPRGISAISPRPVDNRLDRQVTMRRISEGSAESAAIADALRDKQVRRASGSEWERQTEHSRRVHVPERLASSGRLHHTISAPNISSLPDPLPHPLYQPDSPPMPRRASHSSQPIRTTQSTPAPSARQLQALSRPISTDRRTIYWEGAAALGNNSDRQPSPGADSQ